MYVTHAGTPIAPSALTWTVTPATAATVSATGTARLLDTGAATLRATGAGASGSLAIRIFRPPDILFDMHDTVSDSLRTGNRDLYRVALDGRDLVRLTSGDGDNIEPAPIPSPLDLILVFTSYRTGSATLYTVDVNGDAESPIPGLPYPASDPSIAPDSTHVAFIAPSNGSAALWTSAIDGSAAAPVPSGWAPAGAVAATPTWCKGGDSIVVVTTAFGNASLFVQSASSGNGRSLTDATAYNVNPACGPDNQSVAFASTRDGDLGLFVSSGAAGSETVRRLDPSPANDGDPAWLADGRVVFVSAVGTDSAQLGWLDPAQGDSVTRIPLSGSGAPAHPRAIPVVVVR